MNEMSLGHLLGLIPLLLLVGVRLLARQKKGAQS